MQTLEKRREEDCAEKRAYVILDYLAKKIGWDEVIAIDSHSCVVLSKTFYDVDAVRSIEDYSSLYVCRKADLNTVVSRFATYDELLDRLLKISSTGWEIQDKYSRIFLPAGMSLEQILVNMDLDLAMMDLEEREA